jgi:hypothetical protein
LRIRLRIVDFGLRLIEAITVNPRSAFRITRPHHDHSLLDLCDGAWTRARIRPAVATCSCTSGF